MNNNKIKVIFISELINKVIPERTTLLQNNDDEKRYSMPNIYMNKCFRDILIKKICDKVNNDKF